MGNLLRFLSIIFVLFLSSCVFDKGTTVIDFGGKVDPKGALESGLTNAQVTSVSVVNDQLVINGSSLQGIESVKITDNGSFTKTFSIESKNSSQIISNGIDSLSIFVGQVFDLVIGNAYGQAVFPVTFTLQDNAVTSSKILDGEVMTADIANGAVTPAKLSTAGASAGSILQFDGSNWNLINLNGLTYQGTWNANTNTPFFGAANCDNHNPGDYYAVSVSGSTSVDGESSWAAGDWIICSNGLWDKVINTTNITSVFGRTGAITAGLQDMDDVDSTLTSVDGQLLIYRSANSRYETANFIDFDWATGNVTFSNNLTVTGTGFTVGGTAVCLADGTNCTYPTPTTVVNSSGAAVVNASSGLDAVELQVGGVTGAELNAGGTFVVNNFQVSGGTPGAGKVLMSDVSGNGTWQDVTIANVTNLQMTLDGKVAKADVPACTDPTKQLVWDGTSWACLTFTDLNTNAGTICAAGEYLDGDGTCKSVAAGGADNSQAVNVQLVADNDSNASGEIQFLTGATQQMVIDNSGNVGVGVLAPSAKLEVAGQVKITGGTPAAGQVLTSDAAGLATWEPLPSYTLITDANNDTKIQVEESADENVIRFDTAAAERGRVDALGNWIFGDSTVTPLAGTLVTVGGALKVTTGNDICIDGGNCLSAMSGTAGDITEVATAVGSGLLGGATSGVANLSIDADGSTLEVDGVTNKVRVKDVGITDAKIVGMGVQKILSSAGNYLTYAPNGTTCALDQVLKLNASGQWVCAADNNTTYTAGPGLALTSTDFSVNVDGSTLEITTDTLQVKDGGVTDAKISEVGVQKVLSSAGNYLTYAPNGAACALDQVLKLDASGSWVCANDTDTTDNLGNHTATQNLDLATFKLVGNGGTSGIEIDSTGKVGIGNSAPSANLAVRGNLSQALTGTVDTDSSLTTITGTSTLFTTELKVGDAIKIGSDVRTVTAISNNISLTVDVAPSATASGLTGYKDGNLLAVESGAGSNKLVVDGSGRVGIGTSTPATLLDVNGASTFRDHTSISAGKNINFLNGGPAGAYGSFIWSLTNDSASMYAREVTADQTDYVFKMGDNTTADRFVWWIQDYRGSSYDVYPMIMAGNYANFYSGRLYINNDTGNVGIGTTAPTEKLEVVGNIKATGFIGDGSGLTGVNATSADNAGNVAISADSDADTSGEIQFNTAGVTKAVIDNSGKMGIGQTTPSAKLHVAESIGGSPAAIFDLADNTTGNFVLRQGANDYLNVNTTDTSESITLGNTTTNPNIVMQGNVGIGTSSPQQLLDVNGVGIFGTGAAAPSEIIRGKLAGSADFLIRETSTDVVSFGSVSAGPVFNDKLSLNISSGNVGIGTANPAGKLTIAGAGGSASSDGVEWYSGPGNASGYGGWAGRAYIDTPTGSWGTAPFVFSVPDTSGTEVKTMILLDGNVGIGTTTPNQKVEISAPNSQLRITDSDDGDFMSLSYSSDVLAIRANRNDGSTPDFVIHDDGNVGVGTIDPRAKMEINGGGDIGGILDIATGGCGTANQAQLTGAPDLSVVKIGDVFVDEAGNRFSILSIDDTNDILSFLGTCTEDGTNDALVHRNGLIVPVGNVGIGTATPTEKLEVSDGSLKLTQTGADVPIVKLSGKALGIIPLIQTYNPDNALYPYVKWVARDGTVFNVEGDTVDGAGSGTTLFRIQESGNVGIGTSTPTKKLEVNGSFKFNGKCIDSGVYGDGVTQLSTALNNEYQIFFNEDFTARPSITITMECDFATMCTGFTSDGHQIFDLNIGSTPPSDYFRVGWIDNSASSSIYYIHWMAIGPCN